MSNNSQQDDSEQPEFQWFEEFIDGMITLGVALLTLFVGIIVSGVTNLVSWRTTESPKESE